MAAEKFEIKDLDRLLTGSVLPDFYSDKCVNSHLKLRIRGGTRITYDLTRFKEAYGNRMAEDKLHLGYYLHLVQDLLYRDFVYKKHHWNPHTPGNVERLHNDYRLLNPYIIEKYGLQNRLVHPALEADFNVTAEGGIFFLRKKWRTTIYKSPAVSVKKNWKRFLRARNISTSTNGRGTRSRKVFWKQPRIPASLAVTELRAAYSRAAAELSGAMLC